jgi:hypothetical protein
MVIGFLFQHTIGGVPLLLTWGGGLSLGLLLHGWTVGEHVIELSETVLQIVVITGLQLLYQVLYNAGVLCNWAFGYQGAQPVAVQTLGDGLLAIVMLIFISMLAFFSATSSYKANYIEYLIADSWESLRRAEAELSDLKKSDQRNENSIRQYTESILHRMRER